GGPRPLLPPAQVPRAHRGSNPNSSMLQRRLCLALPNRQKTAQTLLRYCLRLFPRAASARSHPARTARCTSCGYLLRRSSSKQLPFFFQPTHWNAAFMLPVPLRSPYFVASPIPLSAQPGGRGGRKLSEFSVERP